MKLIKAHVINFGKLHNYDIDFNEGLNSFIFENGWGKTTLSVFIKSMFYGMEHTTKKNIEENELKKYAPWQGGIYGGSLTFSFKDKEYCVSRSFSLKKNEDTVEIRDLKTNKIIENFSDNLGVFLFGVNRETYERSIHVTLDTSPKVSDDISAKLNNLVEAADLSSFEDASKVLDAKATSIKAKRGGGGELYEIQNKIDFDRAKLTEIDAKILQNEKYEKMIGDVEKKISQLKLEQDSLSEQLSQSAKYESKLRYEQLKADVNNAEKTRASLLEFFNGHLPEPEVIKTIDELSSEYTTVQSNIKNNSASQIEKDQYKALQDYFAGDIPSKDDIEKCIKADEEYKLFRRLESEKKLSETEASEFALLKNKFDGKDISKEKIQECISSLSDIQNIKAEETKLSSELQTKTLELKLLQQTKLKNTKRVIFFAIAAIALIGAGILFFALKNIFVVLAPLVAFIIFILLGIIAKAPAANTSAQLTELTELKKEITGLQEKASEKENACKVFLTQFSVQAASDMLALNNVSLDYDHYNILLVKNSSYESWLASQTKRPEDFELILKTFVKRFCKTDDISSIPSEIQILNDKLNRLGKLEKIIVSDSQNIELQKTAGEKLEKILSQYKTQKALSFAEQVQELHDKLNDIKNAGDNIASALEKIKEFEEDSQNDIESFETLSKPEKSADELREALSYVADEITKENALISDYRKIISDNMAETERKEDIESEIDLLTQKKDEKSDEHRILIKTLELLSQAKEKLDANYSDPMKEGFAKYVNMLGAKLNLVIDTSLKVSVDEEGMLHDSEFLSAGYKDIINFCSRMALIDALFTEEKPPVLLDDPFVNLDDEKITRALELVKDMANEKQILYFACHKSREAK